MTKHNDRAGDAPPRKMKEKEYGRIGTTTPARRDEMFKASDTAWAPWYVAHTDDKKRARLNVITHLLDQSHTSRWSVKRWCCPSET